MSIPIIAKAEAEGKPNRPMDRIGGTPGYAEFAP
jgi:hypothetical protein